MSAPARAQSMTWMGLRTLAAMIWVVMSGYGRCAVSGKKLEIGEIHCHHKVPKHLGGTDEYKNLIIVSSDIHRLIHATKPETIQKYLEQLKLDVKQLRKLKNLRKLANVDNCLKRNAI